MQHQHRWFTDHHWCSRITLSHPQSTTVDQCGVCCVPWSCEEKVQCFPQPGSMACSRRAHTCGACSWRSRSNKLDSTTSPCSWPQTWSCSFSCSTPLAMWESFEGAWVRNAPCHQTACVRTCRRGSTDLRDMPGSEGKVKEASNNAAVNRMHLSWAATKTALASAAFLFLCAPLVPTWCWKTQRVS